MQHVSNDRCAGFVGIAVSIGDEPASIVGVNDLTGRLLPTQHSALHDCPKVAREHVALVREGHMLQDFGGIAHWRRLPGPARQRKGLRRAQINERSTADRCGSAVRRRYSAE